MAAPAPGADAPFEYKPYPRRGEPRTVPPAWADWYVRDAARHWDGFYARNSVNAYKDRHYLGAEFEELHTSARVVLELGCGVGNTAFPLLEERPDRFVYALDFSACSVKLLRADPRYDPERIRAEVCDITTGQLPPELGEVGADAATLIFVLSSMPLAQMGAALRAAASGLRAGGALYFRDYALDDLAQQRFEANTDGTRLDENLYVRRDRTLAYYFSVERADALFREAGFTRKRLEYTTRHVENRKDGLHMERRFITGVFTWPGGPPTTS